MDGDLFALLRAVEAAGTKTRNRNHAMQCPKCQHLRRHHKKARPLSVKRAAEGILYQCWHCGWRGFLPSRDGVHEARPRPRKPRGPRLPVWF